MGGTAAAQTYPCLPVQKPTASANTNFRFHTGSNGWWAWESNTISGITIADNGDVSWTTDSIQTLCIEYNSGGYYCYAPMGISCSLNANNIQNVWGFPNR